MYDVMRMRVAEGDQGLAGIVEAKRYRYAPRIEQTPQGGPFHQVHHHHEVVVHPERVMYGYNVGMSETGVDPDLTQKPLCLPLSVRSIDFQDLERFDSSGDGMLSFEDGAYGSAAQHPNDGVIANRFSGR